MRPRNITALVLLAAASLAIAGWLWRAAFPIAGLKFEVSRAEAQQQLTGVVEALGHPLAGWRSTSGFGEDTNVKNYLELAHGVPRLEELTRAGVSVWYWTVRWFRPEQDEEFTAWLDPQRRLTGFQHEIEEERAGASLDAAAAQAIAEEFLRRYVTHHPLARLRFVSASQEQQPQRIDHHFKWESDDLRVGDAPYRISVGVQGDAIGSYGESLEVPEHWTRDFEKKREVNALCSAIAGWALLPIGIGAFVFFINAVRGHRLRWRGPIPWGWLVLFGIVLAGTQINGIPGLLFSYDTSEKWGSFISKAALNALREVASGVAGLWLLSVLADAVYREGLPQHASFRRALGPFALRDPGTLRALGVGIVFATVALAYVSGFYVVSSHFGAWSPVEINYVQALSGWLPWIDTMNTGLSAAFAEEFTFRVIGILLYAKVLRWRWLAVLLAGATWAFLHSNYAQMPGYIRGLELTVEGVLWGALFLRFGVVTTLTTHYLYNCWLGCLVVLQSPSWPDRIGALVVSLWPVALFGWGMWRRFRADEHVPEFIEELAAPPAAADAPAELGWSHAPIVLSRRRCWQIGLASVAVLALVMLRPAPRGKFAELGKIELSRAQIAARADDVMKTRGFAPEKYRRIITLGGNSVPSTYLLEHGSLDEVAQLFETEVPELLWYARYFRVLEPEEFSLQLDKRGQLWRWSHSIPREAAGEDLDREAALALAREALTREHGVDFTREKLVSDFSTKQEKRRDYSFTFERADWKRGEATLRTSGNVQGAEPVDFNRWINVPEAWSRERAKSGWRAFAADELTTWLSLAKGILATVLLILLLRKHLLPWRLSFLLALFPTALLVLGAVNDAPWFFRGYGTTTPLANYLIRQWAGGAIGLLMKYLGNVLQVVVALGFLRWAFGWTPAALVVWPRERAERRQFFSTTLVLLLAGLALLWVRGAVYEIAAAHWLPERIASYGFPEVNSAVPWLSALAGALQYAWTTTRGHLIQAAILVIAWRRFPRLTIALVLLQPLADAARADTWRIFFFDLAYGEFSLLVTAFLLLAVWRFHFALIFLTYTIWTLLFSTVIFLMKGGPVYRWEALPLLAAGAVACVTLLVWHRRSAPLA